MDFLLDSHKNTSFVETVHIITQSARVFSSFPLFFFNTNKLQLVKEEFFFFFFTIAFHLLRVVLTFKQNKDYHNFTLPFTLVVHMFS